MNLEFRTAPHALDWIAPFFGTRFLELHVRVAASDEEIRKLKSFNMLKRDFYRFEEERSGAIGFLLSSVFAISAYAAWHFSPTMSAVFVLSALSFISFVLSWAVSGKGTTTTIKVSDVVRPAGIPFVRDNPDDIHKIAEEVQAQYQHLFGAMFEIEAFGTTREIIWSKEIPA